MGSADQVRSSERARKLGLCCGVPGSRPRSDHHQPSCTLPVL